MRGTSRPKSAAARPIDAVALLKADHKQVKTWFAEFEATNSSRKKAKLAAQICVALTVHAEIEEQIFYPAFLAATRDKDLHHEAIIEHDGAKQLIAQIQASSPADDYFDSKVHVLSEMIKHHVREEERAGGMFAEARGSRKMNLASLGAALAQRKDALMAKHAATALR